MHNKLNILFGTHLNPTNNKIHNPVKISFAIFIKFLKFRAFRILHKQNITSYIRTTDKQHY